MTRITEASSSDPSETENSRYDQKNSDDVVEKPRHNQNENAGEQGDDRLEMLDADIHGGCSFGVIFGRIYGQYRKLKICRRREVAIRDRSTSLSSTAQISWAAIQRPRSASTKRGLETGAPPR
jgi:hypothetical protein